jgi:hypothetical protein
MEPLRAECRLISVQIVAGSNNGSLAGDRPQVKQMVIVEPDRVIYSNSILSMYE